MTEAELSLRPKSYPPSCGPSCGYGLWCDKPGCPDNPGPFAHGGKMNCPKCGRECEAPAGTTPEMTSGCKGCAADFVAAWTAWKNTSPHVSVLQHAGYAMSHLGELDALRARAEKAEAALFNANEAIEGHLVRIEKAEAACAAWTLWWNSRPHAEAGNEAAHAWVLRGRELPESSHRGPVMEWNIRTPEATAGGIRYRDETVREIIDDRNRIRDENKDLSATLHKVIESSGCPLLCDVVPHVAALRAENERLRGEVRAFQDEQSLSRAAASKEIERLRREIEIYKAYPLMFVCPCGKVTAAPLPDTVPRFCTIHGTAAAGCPGCKVPVHPSQWRLLQPRFCPSHGHRLPCGDEDICRCGENEPRKYVPIPEFSDATSPSRSLWPLALAAAAAWTFIALRFGWFAEAWAWVVEVMR